MGRTRVPALVVGTGLLLAPGVALAPSAWAAGSITAPGTGTVYASDQRVALSARVDARSGATQLHLVEPGGTDHTVDTAPMSLSAQTLSFGFDTDCPAYPGNGCTGRRPARNGTWTVRLTGGATDTGTFSLRVPPAAPRGVRAEASGPRQVVVTWERGLEPDLTGYAVTTSDGRRLADGDTTCPDGTCRAVVTYDADGPSSETLVVRAARACPDCDADLTASSDPVTVDRPAGAAVPGSEPAPDGSPSADPGGSGDGGTAGGGTSGSGGSGPGGTSGSGGSGTGGTSGSGGSGTGGSGSGGSGSGTDGTGTGSGTGASGSGSGAGTGGTGSGAGTPGGTGTDGAAPDASAVAVARADDFALTFKAFGPKLGLPKLPPLPATGVALPDVAPLADGGFAPELPFGQTEVRERVPVASGPVGRVTRAVASVVDTERLARSVATGLVLLLAGAHLRRWLGQAPDGL